MNHINGNAIYNLTHPLFLGVLAQLESEASTVANSIPYDYRIAQIVVEVDYGVEASFVRFDADTPPVLPLPSRFTSWAKRYNSSDLITETVLIGNYASTDVVPEFFRYQGAVVHGAILHSAWEDSNLGVSGQFENKLKVTCLGLYRRSIVLAERFVDNLRLERGSITCSVVGIGRNSASLWQSHCHAS